MQLIGSIASPYVRRIRLLLGDQDYQFDNLQIFGADRDTLRRINPTLKIPALIDGDTTLFDSRVIARYLMQQGGHQPLSWASENDLTVIDAAVDSAVALFFAIRSDMDPAQDALIFNVQRDRLAQTIGWLEQRAKAGMFDAWDYPAMCLYSGVDWMTYRSLFDFGLFPGLQALQAHHQSQPKVAATDPRQAD